MERTSNFKLNPRSIVAATLVILGAGLVILYLGALGLQVKALVSGSLMDSLGSAAGLGLAALHSLQSAAFERGVFFSYAYKFLVLFSAFGALATGIVLMRGTRAANKNAQSHVGGGR